MKNIFCNVFLKNLPRSKPVMRFPSYFNFIDISKLSLLATFKLKYGVPLLF